MVFIACHLVGRGTQRKGSWSYPSNRAPGFPSLEPLWIHQILSLVLALGYDQNWISKRHRGSLMALGLLWFVHSHVASQSQRDYEPDDEPTVGYLRESQWFAPLTLAPSPVGTFLLMMIRTVVMKLLWLINADSDGVGNDGDDWIMMILMMPSVSLTSQRTWPSVSRRQEPKLLSPSNAQALAFECWPEQWEIRLFMTQVWWWIKWSIEIILILWQDWWWFLPLVDLDSSARTLPVAWATIALIF